MARFGHDRLPVEVQPLSGTLECSKTGALYNMHAYWSKKPHDAIRAFIEHFTRPGDLILDPFCGSGGTALAALREGRPCIALDRSPAAAFIARHYCTPADSDKVRATLGPVMARARDLTSAAEGIPREPGDLECKTTGGLYQTRCDRCGGPAQLRTTSYDHGSPRGPAQPVTLAYSCSACGIGHRQATEQDRADLVAIARTPVPGEYPAMPMMHRTGRWGDTWRNGTSSFETVDALFTPRNLRALAALRAAIAEVSDEHVQDVLRFAFSGQLFCATTMQQVRQGGGGFAKGTYYVPQRFLERNAFAGFARRVQAVLAGKGVIAPAGPTPCIALTDARRLPLPDACIDYVFTDPPYGGAVQYAELNFLWEAWLGLDTTWHDAEIVVNRTRGISPADWSDALRLALGEIARVLKPGGWLSLCFAATDSSLWFALGSLLAAAGFEPGDVAALEPTQKSYNRLKSTKKARRDLVVSCRKPVASVAPRPFDAAKLLATVARLG
ncbi:MAG: hypothetical protein KGR26_09530 [Cyanobacteria bacterium REEB65]|nr:hypothetical protein [Cyanobacteria bacterium REEB65]